MRGGLVLLARRRLGWPGSSRRGRRRLRRRVGRRWNLSRLRRGTRALTRRLDEPCHERTSRMDGLAGRDRVPHLVELIYAPLHEARRCRIRSHASTRHLRKQRLERVAQVPHRRDAGHARAALERMQEPLQLEKPLRLGRGRLDIAERSFGLIEELRGFLGKDCGDLGIVARRGLVFRPPLLFGEKSSRGSMRLGHDGKVGEPRDERNVGIDFRAGGDRIGHSGKRSRDLMKQLHGVRRERRARFVVGRQVHLERSSELHDCAAVRHTRAAEQRMSGAIERLCHFRRRIVRREGGIGAQCLDVAAQFFREYLGKHGIHADAAGCGAGRRHPRRSTRHPPRSRRPRRPRRAS